MRNIREVIEVPVFVITLMFSAGTAVSCRMLLPDLNERKGKERVALAEKLIGIEFR